MKKNCFKGCFCSKTDNAINKIIPELVSGSSTQAVTKRQALKTLKKFQGLSNFITAKAFTLIELLVVVLIIGILTAVAVPQYQVVVAKARVARLLPLVKSISNAQNVYKLANGEYIRDFGKLDIEMPGGTTVHSKGFMQYKDFTCYFPGNSSTIISVSCSFPGKTPQIEKYFASSQAYCIASSALDHKVCQNLTKYTSTGDFYGFSL